MNFAQVKRPFIYIREKREREIIEKMMRLDFNRKHETSQIVFIFVYQFGTNKISDLENLFGEKNR